MFALLGYIWSKAYSFLTLNSIDGFTLWEIIFSCWLLRFLVGIFKVSPDRPGSASDQGD